QGGVAPKPHAPPIASPPESQVASSVAQHAQVVMPSQRRSRKPALACQTGPVSPVVGDRGRARPVF
ncbi:MAG: hypothetical protein ACK5Q1_18030, partial [Limnobacter sp.]